ncbi:MAG: hypothetical protein IJU40_00030 [Desulfovibrionaceae bacterium]|nr:hypothetical protein [Desulfovibrionaceae bacterium]
MQLRSKLILNILLAVFVLILIVLGGSLYWISQNKEWVKTKIVAGLEESLGQPCSLGKVDLWFDPWPILKVEEAKSEGELFSFSLKELIFKPAVTDLFLGRVIPSLIKVEKPKIWLKTWPKVAKGNNSSFKVPTGLVIELSAGDFLVGDAQNPSLEVQDLNCYLKSGFGQHVQGDLSLKKGSVLYEGERLFFKDCLALGDVVLDNFLNSNSKFDLKASIKNETWLKELNFSSSIGKSAGDFEARTKIKGNFLKDAQDLPFDLMSTASFDEDLGLINFKRTNISLGSRDSAKFTGSLALKTKSLAGKLFLPRLSLTEWLGFARDLPPGLQISLDEILNAKLDFEIDPQGLAVKRVEATCQGSRFVGTGGVPSWKKPVVTLDMRAARVDLIKGIPEAGAILPKALDFGHGALTPEATSSEGEYSVGYDIRLGADRVDYGPLILKEAQVVIHPAPKNAKNEEDILLDAKCKFYEGDFKGTLQIGGTKETTFNIKTSLKDVNAQGLGRAMPIIPVRKGKWQAQAQVVSQGTALNVFLRNLRGTLKVDCKQGELALPTASKNIAFTNLKARLDPLKMGTWSGSMLGLDGLWKLSLEPWGVNINAEAQGRISFGKERGVAGIAMHNLPTKVSLKLDSKALVANPVSLQAKMHLTQQLIPQVFRVQNLELEGPGLNFQGHAELSSGKEGVAIFGKGGFKVEDWPQSVQTFAGNELTFGSEFKQLAGNLDFKLSEKALVLNEFKVGSNLGQFKGDLKIPLVKGGIPEVNLSLDFFDLDAQLGKFKFNKEGPLDVSPLKTVALKGSLKVSDLIFKKIHLFKLDLPFIWQKGMIKFPNARCNLYGGDLLGSATLHLTNPLKLETSGKLQAANLTWVARDNIDKGRMEGLANAGGVFTAIFKSMADWPRCLSGTFNVRASKGKYQALNRNGKPQGSPTTFELLQASGKIKDGLITSQDIFLQGEDLKLKGRGELNLTKQTIDCKFDVDKRGMPHFPLYIEGPLAKTKTSIGAGQLILNAIGGLFFMFR